MEAGVRAITIIDVLQATPRLLQCFEATPDEDGQFCSSVKALRLVSRQARDAALQAVTGCSVKLSHGPVHPLHHTHNMAKLLCRSPLQRLRIDVTVPMSATGASSVEPQHAPFRRKYAPRVTQGYKQNVCFMLGENNPGMITMIALQVQTCK